ncbi:MAG: mechanosensitive ion channel [Solobacterium sp.]|nr:mechanosensitive ion channel [Solobacterium sp.]
MNNFIAELQALCVNAGGKIVLAILAYLIGKVIIGKIVSLVENVKSVKTLDPTVHSFLTSFVRIGLYIILVISIISILGVPMSSVIAVLASAGVAVGLALQGALGNLAGGIMLMIFRPFNVGDFVSASGAQGVVKEITLFYTVLTTPDEKRVTVPNGALMNGNIENFSSEPNRRVDLVFTCDRGEDFQNVQNIILDVLEKNEKVLKDPKPFVSLQGATNEALEFAVRPYCASADYWDAYFSVIQDVSAALGAAGIKSPKLRVLQETK